MWAPLVPPEQPAPDRPLALELPQAAWPRVWLLV
jgi:hypothetical protein